MLRNETCAQLLGLLRKMKINYADSQDVLDARRKACSDLSKQLKPQSGKTSRPLRRQTIEDLYIRRLGPVIVGTVEFDKAFIEWMRGSPDTLRVALSKVVPTNLLPEFEALLMPPVKLESLKREAPIGSLDNWDQATDQGSHGSGRALGVVSRVIRDTKLTKKVKAHYDAKCQLCKFTIAVPNGDSYAEAHHVKPLGGVHAGPDSTDNIICVCPNCHAALDLGAISIDLEEVSIKPPHVINEKYVDYHNSVIFRGNQANVK